MMKKQKWLLCFTTLSLLLVSNCFARFPGRASVSDNNDPNGYYENNSPTVIARYDMNAFNKTIKRFYRSRYVRRATKPDQRMQLASSFFLHLPYELGPLGEGIRGKFDKEPLYRTNAYDCQTYVSTIIALAVSTNLKDFQKNIIKIRYKNGKVSFLSRNHFTSVDWNPANIKNGFLKDITKKLTKRYKIARTYIDKPNWYRHLTAGNIRIFHWISAFRAQHLIKQLHALANDVKVVESKVTYIPLTVLFQDDGLGDLTVNKKIFDAIPTGSVIEIVRDDWDVARYIGTNLNISHMGFAIHKRKGLAFREASSLKKEVDDVNLAQYLQNYYKTVTDPNRMGIHVMAIHFPHKIEVLPPVKKQHRRRSRRRRRR